MSKRHDYDVVVGGGGASGFGAALAAARRGLRVLLLEAMPALGGTSTLGGVNTWEPGIGGPGLPQELFQRLQPIPALIGVSGTVHFYSPQERYGLSRIDRACPYRESLRRCRRDGRRWRRVTFEPDAMARAMADLLMETGRVELALGARLTGARTEGRRVCGLVFQRAGAAVRVTTRFAVDASGDLALARTVGCPTCLGAEPRSAYGEPSAPAERLAELNGATLCYRVTPAHQPGPDPLPPGVPDQPFERATSINEYPCGDLNVNPLPIMEGWEYHHMEAAARRAECEARVRRHWLWLQREQGFEGYRFCSAFPMVGVREGPRLVGRRVLTENDVRAGLSAMRDADHCIALADHPLDTHGRNSSGCKELREPYGIPWECLLPKEYDNLAVACRGASFSHLAASSCRLTRTMMGLGHAAGLGCAAALQGGVMLPEADVPLIRRWLQEENVALDPSDPRFPEPEPQ